MNLVYYFLKKIYRGEPGGLQEFIDEYTATGFIGLDKAIKTYNPEKIGQQKFATYAMVCIQNEVFMEFRHNKKQVGTVPLYETIVEDDSLTLEDVLEDEDNSIDSFEERESEIYKLKKLHKALQELGDNDRKIIEWYYGFNCERLTQEQISKKVGISRSYISRILLENEKKLGLLLQEFKGEYDYLTPRNELTKKMNETFYKIFDFKDKSEVGKKMVTLLKDKHREILTLYYGLGTKNCLDYDEIAELYDMDVENVISIIDNCIATLKSSMDVKNNKKEEKKVSSTFYRKNNRYGNLVEKYGKEKVEEAFALLDDKNQEILSLYYGINGRVVGTKEIASMYNIANNTVFFRVKTQTEKLEKYIINPPLSKKALTKGGLNVDSSDLISKYGKEKIAANLDKLGEKTREVLKLYYGIDCEPMSRKEIAQKLNAPYINIAAIIRKANDKIVKFIENPQLTIDKRGAAVTISNKYKELTLKYGEEKVKFELGKLNDKAKQIVELYCGIDGDEHSKEEIAEVLSLNVSSIGRIVSRSLDTIENNINKSKLNFKEEFYKLFEGYSSEQIEYALLCLNENNRFIINSLYGLSGEVLTTKQVGEKLNIPRNYVSNYKGVIIKKMKEIMDKPNKGIVNKIGNENKYEKLVDKYGKEKVEKAFSKLEEQNQEILSLYYGLNNKIASIREIANIYHFKPNTVWIRIKSQIEKLEEYINNPPLSKKEEFYKLFEGYSSEQIEYALSCLSENNRFIINSLYGLSGEVLTTKQVGDKLNIPRNYVSNYRINIVKRMKEIMNKPNKGIVNKIGNENKYEKLVDKYGEEKVKEALNKLPIRNQEMIKLSFGIDGETLSQKEIGGRYNISQGSVSLAVSRNLKKIESEIINPKSIVKEKSNKKTSEVTGRDVKFKKLLEEYSEPIVYSAIKELSESEKAFLVMYYTLGNVKKYELSEIASKIHVDEKYFDLLESKILEKLVQEINKINIKNKHLLIERMNRKFYIDIGSEDKAKAKVALKNLSEMQLKLIWAYYGLNGKDVLTIEDLSEKLKTDKRTVEMYISKIIDKIKSYLLNGGRK